MRLFTTFLPFNQLLHSQISQNATGSFQSGRPSILVTAVMLCESGGFDSGAGDAAEPKPHLLGCNAVSQGEQLQKCWRIRMPACICRWKHYDPSKWKALLTVTQRPPASLTTLHENLTSHSHKSVQHVLMCWTATKNALGNKLNFRHRIKSRLPFADIIRMLAYSTRFQDKG